MKWLKKLFKKRETFVKFQGKMIEGEEFEGEVTILGEYKNLKDKLISVIERQNGTMVRRLTIMEIKEL